eukprot:436247-Prymnesium_polylepis.1
MSASHVRLWDCARSGLEIQKDMLSIKPECAPPAKGCGLYGVLVPYTALMPRLPSVPPMLSH